MDKYFKDITTLEELRKQYKELLKIHHPDNGGDVGTMQEINAEYDSLFKTLKRQHEESESRNAAGNGNSDNAKYDFEADEKLREVLSHIICFAGINIDIVGTWLWVDGNTYPYKNELKALGFRWSRQRKKWHWHGGDYRRFGSKNLSYEEIQIMYGSTAIKPQQRPLLQA